jgi:hypothetical protein
VAKKTARRKPAKKITKRRATSSRKKNTTHRSKPTEPSWVKVLRKRKEPLSLAIEENGEIAFWKYSFDGPHVYNLMAWHPEGDIDFGCDEPTRRERYGLDTPSFKRLSYKSKKVRVAEALESLGHEYMLDDGLPWQDTEQGLNDWLAVNVIEDGIPEPPTTSAWDNQYLAGRPIHDALTPKERKLFGIAQWDIGGPASGGCMATFAECSMEDLNTLIRKKGLPFVVVEDQRDVPPRGLPPRLNSPKK